MFSRCLGSHCGLYSLGYGLFIAVHRQWLSKISRLTLSCKSLFLPASYPMLRMDLFQTTTGAVPLLLRGAPASMTARKSSHISNPPEVQL